MNFPFRAIGFDWAYTLVDLGGEDDRKPLEKVFSFLGTDKDYDAQLKLGHCHRSMGNIKKAKEEYQRLLDYFPGSEFYDKARNSLKQLSSQ